MSNYPFFSQAELACPCGCNGRMEDSFMLDVVIPMREELNFPFNIPTGGAYRCKDYDGKYGAHQGHALDILCNSRERFLIIDWLVVRNYKISLGELQGNLVTRIGINRGSIHFDDLGASSGKTLEVIWDYYSNYEKKGE